MRMLIYAVLLVGAIALITHDRDEQERPEPPTVQVEWRDPNAGPPGSVG